MGLTFRKNQISSHCLYLTSESLLPVKRTPNLQGCRHLLVHNFYVNLFLPAIQCIELNNYTKYKKQIPQMQERVNTLLK